MAASVSSTRSPAAPIALRPAAGHSRSAPLRQAVSVVLLLALWQALSGWFADATVVPSPGAVVSRAGELVASGGLLRDAAATLGLSVLRKPEAPLMHVLLLLLLVPLRTIIVLLRTFDWIFRRRQEHASPLREVD